MRIVLTHQHAWPEVRRGTERYVHELAGALAGAGHEVLVLATASVASTGIHRGVEVRCRRARGLRGLLGPQSTEWAFSLGLLADRDLRAADVWHANGVADGAMATRWSGLPGRRPRSVFTDHGFPAAASRQARPDRAFHDRVVADIDDYVCVSEAAASHLVRDYGRVPVVRSGGIDSARFTPGGARAPRPLVLFVGDVDETRKHAAETVAAVAALRARGLDVSVAVAGAGDHDRMLRAAASLAGSDASVLDDCAVALGPVDPDALVEHYRRAWVTALPAAAEAFGLVLVESMACGTPVVALAEGGPTEIVTPGTGVLAPDAAPSSIAAAIEETLDLAADPTTTERCRTHARGWDWAEVVVPDMERIYEGAA